MRHTAAEKYEVIRLVEGSGCVQSLSHFQIGAASV